MFLCRHVCPNIVCMPSVIQSSRLEAVLRHSRLAEDDTVQVLVANTPMDTDKIKMYGARVKTDSMTKVAEIEAAERNKMKVKCEQIIAQGINVFINRQLIYNYPEQIFTEAGVMSIEHAGVPHQPQAIQHVDCLPSSPPTQLRVIAEAP